MKSKNIAEIPNLRYSGLTTPFKMTSTLLALSQLSGAATPATENAPAAKEDATPLPKIVVQADRTKTLYNPQNLETPKYTVPLVDVPQTVTVIPEEVIKEQGASNLREILKNVPGISIQAGEGSTAPPGDSLAIRGFNARYDMFVDGVRDFGLYSRDPFNIEQVEVLKGPSSTNGGRGSTGGSINLSSKMPQLTNAYEIMLGGGTDNYTRTTFDVNQTIPQLSGAAVRVNGVYHYQDIPGRDNITQERWGIAPSVSFGLGTDTRFTLSYFHLSQNNVPDFGIPWIPNAGDPKTGNNTGLAPGRPHVSYGNWYGLVNRDNQDTQTDIFTAIFEHDFNENLKLRNLTRFGDSTIDLNATPPRFYGMPAEPLPPGANPQAIRRNDWKSLDQRNTILANQTELRYDFQTGFAKHELVAALEFSHEKSDNHLRSDLNLANVPDANLFHPNPYDAYIPNIVRNGGFERTTLDTYSGSLFDTVSFGEQWMVSGGLRFDSFNTDFESRKADSGGLPGKTLNLSRNDDEPSYRAAITYKPTQDGSIYLGYGTSYNPPGEGLSLGNKVDKTSYFDVDPEQNRTIELGTKWELLERRLLLSAAIFRTDKTDARTEDPTDSTDVTVLDGEQRVQGFEFGFTGQITDDFRILGGYTYLNSDVRSSKNLTEIGNELMNTPENSFSLWMVHDLPKGFQIGVGTQYVGSRYNTNDSVTRHQADSYMTLDALIGYQLNGNVSFRLNGYNLTNNDYIDQVGSGHFVPGPDRSFVLTADIKF